MTGAWILCAIGFAVGSLTISRGKTYGNVETIRAGSLIRIISTVGIATCWFAANAGG